MLEKHDLKLAETPMHPSIVHTDAALNEVGQYPALLIILTKPPSKMVRMNSVDFAHSVHNEIGDPLDLCVCSGIDERLLISRRYN